METLNSNYFVFFIAVSFAIIFVLSFFILNRPVEQHKIRKIITSRFIGAFLLGAVPFAIINFMGTEINFYIIAQYSFERVIISLVIFIPLILLITYSLSKKSAHQKLYPLIRTSNWSVNLYILNLASWIVYLLAYESLFRGLLLFSSLKVYGIFVAIAINTILYAFAHIPKGKFETISAIPLGIAFCIASLYTGTFMTAFILHFTMTISNDIFCFYNNPEMRISHHHHHQHIL